MTRAIGNQTIHFIAQNASRFTQARKGVFFSRYLRHIQAQRKFTDGRQSRIVSHRRLGIKRQRQNGWQALHGCSQHHATWNHTCYESPSRCMLMNVPRAPSSCCRNYREAQLGIVLAGKLIELACACYFFQHIWKLGRAIDGIGKGLGFDDKFGKFNFIQCAHAIGQLNTSLKRMVATTRCGGLPFACGVVQTFYSKWLGTHSARCWQGGQSGIARNLVVNFNGGNDINQRIEWWFSFWYGQCGHGIVQKTRVLWALQIDMVV